MPRRVGTVVAAVVAVALGGVLLWPDGWAVNRLVVRIYVFFLDLGVPRAVTPDDYATALNVLAFVPLGWLGVSALRRSPVLVVAVLAAASALVETAQLWPGLGRQASLADLACNTAGAAVGAVLASALVHDDDAGRDEAVDEAADPRADDRR